MCKWFFFLMVLFLSGFVDRCFASISMHTCEFYFDENSAAGKNVVDIFSEIRKESAVKVCTHVDGMKWYYIASEIRIENEVSYYKLIRIFKKSSDNSVGWTYHNPDDSFEIPSREIFMCEESAGCKRQDDNRFIRSSNVTVSAFRELKSHWATLSMSKNKFEKAISSFWFDFAKQASSVKTLRDAIYGNDPPIIFSFSYTLGGEIPHPCYTIHLKNESKVWSVDFDFYQDGLQFYSIGKVVY